MRTIPAREIKRRGITAVDDLLCKGAVHVIKNDESKYVILSEEHYAELLEDREEGIRDGLKESLEDVAAGRVRRVPAQQLIDEFGLED